MSISSVLLAFLAPMARAKPDREREIAGLRIDLADARRELAGLRQENGELRERVAFLWRAAWPQTEFRLPQQHPPRREPERSLQTERMVVERMIAGNLPSCTPSRYRAATMEQAQQAPLPPFFRPLPPSAWRI